MGLFRDNCAKYRFFICITAQRSKEVVGPCFFSERQPGADTKSERCGKNVWSARDDGIWPGGGGDREPV